MKVKVSNYSFDKTAKTVTFNDYVSIALDNVLLITNVTRNVVIYNFTDPAKGGTVATNVLTLTFDTTSQANADKLLIYYEDGTATEGVSGSVTANLGTLNGAATSAKQDTGNTSLASIDTKLPASPATTAKQDTGNTSLASIDTKTPASPATAGNQTTGNSSLASIDTKLTDNATQTTLATRLSESDFDTKAGSLTETAPATDTASSGLNGRLQRIAQRLSSLIALLPVSIGQKAKTGSLSVTLASDQDAVTANIGTSGSLALDATLTGGTQQIQGNTASAATDSGNPIKIGGAYNSTQPTLTNGQRGDFQADTRGNQKVTLFNNDTATTQSFANDSSDGVGSSATANKMVVNTRLNVLNASGQWDRVRSASATTGTTGQGLVGSAPQLLGSTNYSSQKAAIAAADGDTGIGVPYSLGMLHNGTNLDRTRANESASLLASSGRTTTQTSADLVNYNGATFLDVILDVTTIGTGNITLSIDGKDSASGKYYNLLTGAAVSSNSTNVYRVGVGLAAAANATANLPLPRTFRIVVTANNANSVTYSVGYNLTRG